MIILLYTDLRLIYKFTSSTEVSVDIVVLDETIVLARLEVTSQVYIVNGCVGVCEEGEHRIWHFVIGKVDSELQKLGGDSSHLQSSTVGRETKLWKVTTEAGYHLESVV